MYKLIQKIWNLSGEYKKKIQCSILTDFLFAIFNSFPYIAIWKFFTDLENNCFTKQTIITCIGIFATGIILAILFKTATMRLEQYAGNDVAAQKRLDIGDRLKRVPMGFFQEKNLGEITTVLTLDISNYEKMAASFLDSVINGSIQVVISCLVLMVFDIRIGLVFLLTSLLALFVMNAIQKKGENIAQKHTKAMVDAVSVTLQYMKGISTFRLYHAGQENTAKTKQAYEEYREKAYGMEIKVLPLNTLLHCILRLGMGAVILFATVLAGKDILPVSTAALMIVAAFNIFTPVEDLAGAAGIMRLLDTTIHHIESVEDMDYIDENSKDIQPKKFDISFENVSFAYEEGRDALKNVSYQIPQNTFTAIVGPSGSGKTTVTRMIARFWDADKGKIKIGGNDIKDITCDALLSQMAIVFQNVYLFNDTIAANIRYGKPDATQSEIEEAAKKACCHDFIMTLPNGYETVVGEGGSHLSGGEKQRISIARAVLKDAPIILLDEATASIDPENEVQLQQAINSLVQGKTLIVIAHRLSTIKDADQILVIDQGQLSEKGTHQELLEKQGLYWKLWNMG
ncbi:MAG: ABC transporter ATP-binding protein [Roseburia sp.]